MEIIFGIIKGILLVLAFQIVKDIVLGRKFYSILQIFFRTISMMAMIAGFIAVTEISTLSSGGVSATEIIGLNYERFLNVFHAIQALLSSDAYDTSVWIVVGVSLFGMIVLLKRRK